MSWWTEDGHITLPKAVINLLAEAAMALREEFIQEIYDNDLDLHTEVGVPVFDNLDPKTQVFALAYVLRHLSDADLPSPDLYAWNEGTAYALFVRAEDDVVTEIEFEQDPDTSDDDLKFRIRHLIRDALVAVDSAAQPPSIRCRNLDDWRGCLEAISDHLFWDRDFLSEATYADLDPVGSKWLKQRTGVADDYFSTPPPLVREEDYRAADRCLRQLAGYLGLPDPWGRELG
jgi:hypothetical protein